MNESVALWIAGAAMAVLSSVVASIKSDTTQTRNAMEGMVKELKEVLSGVERRVGSQENRHSKLLGQLLGKGCLDSGPHLCRNGEDSTEPIPPRKAFQR